MHEYSFHDAKVEETLVLHLRLQSNNYGAAAPS
jgi:hypothetical protein